ncbi:hypothetical protein [Deinococcus arenicola]|uniref:Uncharacterized protein n=1 Tax=Deinococcus arenicola TaxID=2994950 RepID=A0ABU4DUG0_9DEIO|nr:hypothetical protein [Deinococcus sp. ZS9-10]MDV6376071.1 hypothetical protein [Deinococcus sp. ZS9-10]
MDYLALYLAEEARRLGLDSAALEDAPPDTVQTFAQTVVNKLVALGLLRGREEVGCWAAPRSAKH